MSEDIDRYLEAAKMLRNGVETIELSKKLGMNSEDIEIVKNLLKAKYIEFNEDGSARWTVNEDVARKYISILRESRPKQRRKASTQSIPQPLPLEPIKTDDSIIEYETALNAVQASVHEKIADRARTMVSEDLKFAETVAPYIVEYLSKKGYSPSEIRERLPHQLIIEAFQKAERAEMLERELEDLKAELEFYRERVDPLMRLEAAMHYLAKFVEIAIVLDQLGIDIMETDVGRFYMKLFESFLTGKPFPSTMEH
ncbi:MAG: hypothetical protein OH337_04150 [Candidatus Parvarchaeota archaeon]|nr:hypothetical protein [Candidatus Haiyanarchaeum thermophilum]